MKTYYYVKQILDFITALLLLLVLWPILLVAAVVIKIDSPGPVFFLQERLGQNGRIFKIYKFRTMVDGAINIGNGLHTYDKDPRITKAGNFLRKTSIDELPQLINILKGEMSLIGPRPPVPYYPRTYKEYDETQVRRFTVKPGITGLAQVKFRNSVPWDERIKLDVQYVENMSLKLDLYILLRTIMSLIKKDNIYENTYTNKNISI